MFWIKQSINNPNKQQQQNKTKTTDEEKKIYKYLKLTAVSGNRLSVSINVWANTKNVTNEIMYMVKSRLLCRILFHLWRFSLWGVLCVWLQFQVGRVLTPQQKWRPPAVDHACSIFYSLPKIIWTSGYR